MSVTLLRAYQGFSQGQIAEFTAELEGQLIAQGLATAATVNAVTPGPITSNTYVGSAVIPAGSSSVVITNSYVNANSKFFAVVAQAAADSTLLRIERILTTAGSATIYGTANATAAVTVDWALVLPNNGDTPAL